MKSIESSPVEGSASVFMGMMKRKEELKKRRIKQKNKNLSADMTGF